MRVCVHSCCLVICLLIWFVLQLLSTFHRWDLASKSHTKSFTEEVLLWEIDLEGKHLGAKNLYKSSKPTNRRGSSQISRTRRRSNGGVAGKESHDEHFQLRLELYQINGGTGWVTFYVNTRPIFSGEILIFLLNQKYAGAADLKTRNYECEARKQDRKL